MICFLSKLFKRVDGSVSIPQEDVLCGADEFYCVSIILSTTYMYVIEKEKNSWHQAVIACTWNLR